MTSPDNQIQQDQSDSELERVTGNIPSIPPLAPSPIDPSTPSELPPYVDPVPKDPNNLYC